MKFLPYSPDQAWLLPPSVKDVLGQDHLCFFIHGVVEQLDLRSFEAEYVEEGRRAYHPALLLKVWLYAYALQITSSRRLEQRLREDLALRYLAGATVPDHWTLNEFRRRHRKALNDVFTQVVELARKLGLGRMGQVAVDSSPIAASASRDRLDTVPVLRAQRARDRRAIRRWQQACDQEDPSQAGGSPLDAGVMEVLRQGLAETERRLQKLEKSESRKLSRTDPESRFLRQRQGYVLGYRASLVVSQDHLILEQRVTNATNDNDLLLPLVDAVEERTGERPQQLSADSGFFSLQNLEGLAARGLNAYVPDSNLARELNGGRRARKLGRALHPEHRRMRRKLRGPMGRAIYARRKGLIEPVFGVLKEQRGMRRFRLRGLVKVGIEMALACTAYNLTRLWRVKAQAR
jgi:transposase/IS5 family transposase